eukprot:977643-Amphidinium_carterae.1
MPRESETFSRQQGYGRAQKFMAQPWLKYVSEAAQGHCTSATQLLERISLGQPAFIAQHSNAFMKGVFQDLRYFVHFDEQ